MPNKLCWFICRHFHACICVQSCNPRSYSGIHHVHLCVFPVFWCEALFRSACKSLNQQHKRMNCFQWLKADTTKHFQDIITEHFHSSAAIGLKEFEFLLIVILYELQPLLTQTHGSDLCGATMVLRDIWLRCSSRSGPKHEGKVTQLLRNVQVQL